MLKKRGSENMQQIYRRTPMPKCGINEVAFEEEMVGKYQERKHKQKPKTLSSTLFHRQKI